jgi:hypothetical protein
MIREPPAAVEMNDTHCESGEIWLLDSTADVVMNGRS